VTTFRLALLLPGLDIGLGLYANVPLAEERMRKSTAIRNEFISTT